MQFLAVVLMVIGVSLVIAQVAVLGDMQMMQPQLPAGAIIAIGEGAEVSQPNPALDLIFAIIGVPAILAGGIIYRYQNHKEENAKP